MKQIQERIEATPGRTVAALRYAVAAVALKLFSLTPQTRRFYRALGSRFGQGRHARLTAVDVERGLWLRRMLETHGCDLGRARAILELGTGWTHFYGLFLRLFGDAKMVLFDVQDNRSLDATHARFAGLADLLLPALPLADALILKHIRAQLALIASARTFRDLYSALRLEYLIEQSGSLDDIPAQSFDAVFSVDVLEHVQRAALPRTARAMLRVLRPGGLAVHQVGVDDHLTHYAPGMSPKEYLRFSDNTWRWCFENRLQYFNRMQGPELTRLFIETGFELLVDSQDEDPTALSRVVPHARYRHMDPVVLRGTRVYLVLRKPFGVTRA